MLTLNRVKRHGLLLTVGVVVLAVYFSTLQTIPNGSSHPYMIDVGEIQVALHVWGTLHATGYPQYTMLGNLFTPLPTLLGVSPAAAAGLFSCLWTLAALCGFYALLHVVTHRPTAAACGVLLLAFTRSIWIHSVVAEVYSMSLAVLIGLWLLGVMPMSFRRRIWGLALLGGIGIAHHRALAFAGVGLVFAVLPEVRCRLHDLPRLLPGATGLFLLGFAPYLYLPLRAGADWSYSRDLNTWNGFWFHFFGREADYLITRPDEAAGWLDNLTRTVDILARELTAPGLVVALLCVMFACWRSPYRRFAWITTLSGIGFFVFAVAYHQAVLPEAILMMTLPSLVTGVALTLDWVWVRGDYAGYMGAGLVVLWSFLLIPQQHDFIADLTDDRTGLQAIAAARNVPRNILEEPVFMLSWGPRYFAASYSRLVTGENADLAMVDHNADFAALAGEGKTLYTQPDTLVGYPLAWWETRIGGVYLTSAGYDVVRLSTQPRLIENMDTASLTKYIESGIWLAGYEILCDDEHISLAVGWYAESQPDRDLSVKVHLVSGDSPQPLAQADKNAPVYGLRPTSMWLAGELIQDHYQLPRLPDGERVVLALYEQMPDGAFIDYGETIIPVDECVADSDKALIE